MVEKEVHIQQIEASELLSQFEALNKKIEQIGSNNDKPKELSGYLTRQEVAKIFKVSLVTVSDWCSKGILKSYKIANRVYFKPKEVESALTEIKPKYKK